MSSDEELRDLAEYFAGFDNSNLQASIYAREQYLAALRDCQDERMRHHIRMALVRESLAPEAVTK